MEIKYGTPDSVKNLLERCLTLKINAKKMKFFFKRYLQYEISYGTEGTVENVKRKANEYIEQIINKGDIELEDQIHNENGQNDASDN